MMDRITGKDMMDVVNMSEEFIETLRKQMVDTMLFGTSVQPLPWGRPQGPEALRAAIVEYAKFLHYENAPKMQMREGETIRGWLDRIEDQSNMSHIPAGARWMAFMHAVVDALDWMMPPMTATEAIGNLSGPPMTAATLRKAADSLRAAQAKDIDWLAPNPPCSECGAAPHNMHTRHCSQYPRPNMAGTVILNGPAAPPMPVASVPGRTIYNHPVILQPDRKVAVSPAPAPITRAEHAAAQKAAGWKGADSLPYDPDFD